MGRRSCRDARPNTDRAGNAMRKEPGDTGSGERNYAAAGWGSPSRSDMSFPMAASASDRLMPSRLPRIS
jgi:hypothetical protein